MRSADGALAIAIQGDRSDQARAQPLASYVRDALLGLRDNGYADVRVGSPRVQRGLRYAAQAISASGRLRRTGVRQAIELVALRRPNQVTYTLFVFRSAAVPAARYAATLAAMLRSFRARAPALSGG